MVHIGEHKTAEMLGLTVNLDTVISMLIVSAVITVFAIFVRFVLLAKRKDGITPGLCAVEMLYEFVETIPVGVMGNKGLAYVPFIGTLFIFILASNLFGLIPLNAVYSVFFEKSFGHIPELIAPTADINTTAALAILVFLSIHFYGIKEKRLAYFKHFFSPSPFFLPLNLMEEIAKPFSLAIRLFGNTFGKETIIVILIALTAFPIIYPIPILALGLFIAFIQAYIFSLLSTFYISAALSEGH